MSMMRYKLCDEDRAEFGGEEWYTLDVAKLANARGKELARIEVELGMPLAVPLGVVTGTSYAIEGIRAVVWLARYQNGLRTPFNDFDIRTMKVDTEEVPDQEELDIAPLPESSTGSGPTST